MSTTVVEITEAIAVLEVGEAGPPGATGPAGAAGAAGAPGVVQTVTAGDSTITAGGTSANPTVKVTAGTFDAAGAAAAAQAASQPLDSDLTAIAALTTTSYGRALLALADAAALRTAGGLGTAATVDTGTGAGNAILGNDARLSDTRTPTDNSVTSAKIVDGAIVNADINAAAAIVLSKLATDPLARANHTGTQTMSTISDAGSLATLSSVDSAHITDGTIVNGDISASAAIVLSKLAVDPLARANHTGTQTASTVSDFDTQVATTAVLKANGGKETVQAHGNTGSTETIDLSNGNVHTAAQDQACTYTLSGFTNGVACSLTLILTSVTGAATWPAAVKWADATAPTLSGVTILTFLSTDGGTTIYGFPGGKAFA